MTHQRCRAIVLLVALLAPPLWAQSKITIAAGTPEDKELQAISNQGDAQKRTAMLEEFVRKFAANPAAVAYGNWRVNRIKKIYNLKCGIKSWSINSPRSNCKS